MYDQPLRQQYNDTRINDPGFAGATSKKAKAWQHRAHSVDGYEY